MTALWASPATCASTTQALAYDRLDYPVLDTLQPRKLNNMRRGVGRPKKVGPALSKDGPSHAIREKEYVEMGNEQLEIDVINWEPLEEVISETREQPVNVVNDATTIVEAVETLESDNSFDFDDDIIDQFLKNKMEEKRIEKPEILENQVACEICENILKINSIKAHLKSTRCSNKRKAICQEEEVLSPPRAKRGRPALKYISRSPSVVARVVSRVTKSVNFID